MVYTVGDMLRGTPKKIDIINGSHGDLLGFLNFGEKGGLVVWNVKNILKELNTIKDYWEKQN